MIPGFDAERSLGGAAAAGYGARHRRLGEQAKSLLIPAGVLDASLRTLRCCQRDPFTHRFYCVTHRVSPWDSCHCAGSAVICQPPVLTQ